MSLISWRECGFDAVRTVPDFYDQGSSYGSCNSEAGPKTSHFITERYVRENATAKEPPPGLNPGAPTYICSSSSEKWQRRTRQINGKEPVVTVIWMNQRNEMISLQNHAKKYWLLRILEHVVYFHSNLLKMKTKILKMCFSIHFLDNMLN